MPMFLILIGALIAPVFFMATHGNSQIADSAAREDATRAVVSNGLPAQLSDAGHQAVTEASFYTGAGQDLPTGVTKQLQANNLLSATSPEHGKDGDDKVRAPINAGALQQGGGMAQQAGGQTYKSGPSTVYVNPNAR